MIVRLEGASETGDRQISSLCRDHLRPAQFSAQPISNSGALVHSSGRPDDGIDERRMGRAERDRHALLTTGMTMTKPKPLQGSLRLMLSTSVLAIVWLLGSALVAQQAASSAARRTSGQRVKHAQVMKGIPVDDFMGTMGIICGALGLNCTDWHTGAGTEKANRAAVSPKKPTAA